MPFHKCAELLMRPAIARRTLLPLSRVVGPSLRHLVELHIDEFTELVLSDREGLFENTRDVVVLTCGATHER